MNKEELKSLLKEMFANDEIVFSITTDYEDESYVKLTFAVRIDDELVATKSDSFSTR